MSDSEEAAAQLKALAESDPVLAQINARHQKQVGARMKFLGEKVWEVIHARRDREFKKQCRKAGVPIQTNPKNAYLQVGSDGYLSRAFFVRPRRSNSGHRSQDPDGSERAVLPGEN